MPTTMFIVRVAFAVIGLQALICGVVFKQALADSDKFYEAMKREDVVAMSQFVNQIDNANLRLDDGRTALMIAAKLGSSEMVDKLIDAGAEVNEKNFNGGTALMYSAIRGSIPTLKLLLNHGAQVNISAKFGWTALMVAAAKGHSEQVSILLSFGSNANARDIYEWTPLMRATYSGHHETVVVLLEHSNTDVNAQDENGATALHHAATNGDDRIVQLLLDHNASVEIKDRFELNARDRALANEHVSTVSLFDKQYKKKIFVDSESS